MFCRTPTPPVRRVSLDSETNPPQFFPSYALIAGMIVFCIAGIIVQFCYTGRSYDHRSGKNKKRDPYGYDESTAPLLPQ
jgi:hypothetical protein